MSEPNHARRFTLLWLLATVIALPIVIWVIGPLIGPGKGSDQASGQGTDATVLAVIATPVILLVMLYLAYAVVFFRQPSGGALEGPAVRGDAKVQTTWIVITSVLVLIVAVYGTVRLESANGAGSGSGATPLSVPSGPKLPVQVIAQQWYFTYRFPTYGGVETPHLVLPVNTQIELNVTSLDVIHSFWAYQLGVKADANPQVNNVAFTTPQALGSFVVRCSELCGIWHGAMFNYGLVEPQTAFQSWASGVQAKEQSDGVLAALPPFALTYDPTVIPQLGKTLTTVIGITGAPGYFYGPANPVQP